MERFACAVGVFLLSLFLPWWVFVVASAGLAFRFTFFVEAVVVAALYDILYASHPLFGVRFFVTALTLVLCGGVFFIRRYIRYDAFSS